MIMNAIKSVMILFRELYLIVYLIGYVFIDELALPRHYLAIRYLGQIYLGV